MEEQAQVDKAGIKLGRVLKSPEMLECMTRGCSRLSKAAGW